MFGLAVSMTTPEVATNATSTVIGVAQSKAPVGVSDGGAWLAEKSLYG